MMALSKFFNCNTLQIPDSKTSTFNEAMPEEVAPNIQHLFPYSDESFFLSNTLFENYIDPTAAFLYPSDIHSPFDPFISIPPEYYNHFPCSKRQKLCFEEQQVLLHSQELTTPTIDEFGNGYSFQSEETQQKLFCMDLQCEENADMLNAVAKYVKFLQAQVGMLELMNSLEHEDEATPPSEILHALVFSPFLQEKLYVGQKCFLPKKNCHHFDKT
ncbi:hypothetical protein VNO80_02130 [Phaseolus coccineus]|uniref:Uncharacterized protein n=1 Tax=Phaseolus coccineus TaxID=3886 RepID=A0AAN9RL65_PHACN